jgi:hypothetical protein
VEEVALLAQRALQALPPQGVLPASGQPAERVVQAQEYPPRQEAYPQTALYLVEQQTGAFLLGRWP